MFDIDKWQEILSSIRKNLLRTFLTGFSVGWGIFMLVILLGLGNGFEMGVRNTFENDAKTAISFWLGQTSIAYDGLQPGRYLELKNEDLEEIEKKLKDKVEFSSGEFSLWRNTNVVFQDRNENFDLVSLEPEHKEIEFKEILEGRYINQIDIDEKRKVAVVGHVVVEKLFDTIPPIGKYISVNDVAFKIVGVYKQKLRQNSRGRLLIPLSTAQSLFSGKGKLDEILFTANVDNVEESKVFVKEVTEILAENHHFDPKDKRAIGDNNRVETGEIFTTLFLGVNAFVWFIAFMTLLAGIIGVGNIMLIVVNERTKEIGVRKALGATPWSIISLVLQESIVITAFSGYAGMIVGLLIIEGIASVMTEAPMFAPPQVKLSYALTATVLVVVLGVIAGVFPAIKAARIKPIEALRS